MRILILKDTLTTIDNFVLRKFVQGEVAMVRESVACRLIMRGDAKYIESDYDIYTIS